MNLYTQLTPEPSGSPVTYEGRLLLLGSCFVTNIGSKLRHYKFPVLQNPFGILYHPQAIQNLLSRAVEKRFYSQDDLFFHGEGWHSFDAHSVMSRMTPADLEKSLNSGLRETRAALEESSHIIMTFGTAWVYRHKATGALVANCHKVPQNEFSKELLSVGEVAALLRNIIRDIRTVNSSVHCIVTISPVRHLRDGFVGNQRSKAHLIAGIHAALEADPKENGLSYFPAYEVVMDELRDYRFYESDLVHPNSLAIEYVWEKFRQAWIDERSYPVMKELDSISKGLKHRPFNPESQSYMEFRKSLDQKIAYLKERYPFMDFDQ